MPEHAKARVLQWCLGIRWASSAVSFEGVRLLSSRYACSEDELLDSYLVGLLQRFLLS